ncbi:MAG: hypothetical protein ACM3MI_08520 [Clostridiales bacterium]
MKHFLILLALSVFNVTFWLTELLLFGWGGMECLDHFFWAYLVIPGFSIAWAAYYTKELNHVRHLIVYPIFMCAVAILSLAMVIQSEYMFSPMRVLGPLFVFMVVMFIINLFVSILEKRYLSFWELLILFFSSALIPIVCGLTTFFIFSQSYLFSDPRPDPIENLTYPVHWLKTGALFFAYTLYEGLFFLYLKGLIFTKVKTAIH